MLSSIVKEAVKLLKAAALSTITIKTRIGGDSGLILGDPTQIEQVLVNLCANAAYAMPEMTGIELAREILSLRPDMPIILCTGFSHLVDEVRAKAAVSEPFS
jgi:signal transduction histidine kinase